MPVVEDHVDGQGVVPREPFALDWRDGVAVVAFLAFASTIRAAGFTRFDLWYDDAWSASPAKASFSQALHMGVAAPGYSLLQRSWIQLDPNSTSWAQLPAFAFGVLGILAIFALIRMFRFSRFITYVTTGLVVVSPIAVTYSTRVKEYAADFLLSCLLLALAERVRRAPTRRNLAQLGVATVLCPACSLSTVIVAAAIWTVVLVISVVDEKARRSCLIATGIVTTLVGVVVLTASKTIPQVLNLNWRRRGFLVDYRTFHGFRHTVLQILSGLGHGLFGIPTYPSGGTTLQKLSTALLAVVVLSALVVGTHSTVRRTFTTRTVHPVLAAAIVLFFALLAAFADRVPLGDGRTDEVLFPALLILLASAMANFFRWVRERWKIADQAVLRTTVAAAVVLGISGVAFGITHEARYPTISLRSVLPKIDRANHAAGFDRSYAGIVVDGFNNFGWGYYDITPSELSFAESSHYTWPQGFHFVSKDPNVVLSPNAAWRGEFSEFSATHHLLWYVGFTSGTFNPSIKNPWLAIETPTSLELRREGWVQSSVVQVSLHCYAALLRHRDG